MNPVPRAQPGHRRGDQPGRAGRADPGRLPRRRPAADRWRRHLLRDVQRGGRAQGQRRGPHRRRPRRQGRDGRARRRPVGSPSGSTATPSSATRPRPRSRSRRCWARCSSRWSRPGRASWTRRPRSPSSAPPRRTTSSRRSRAWPTTSEQIDTDQLAESLTTLADLTRNTPEEFRGALDGVSPAVGQRRRQRRADQQAAGQPQRVSTVLDARDQDIIELMRGQRRAVPGPGRRAARRCTSCWSPPHAVQGADRAGRQSREDLKPALTHLENVVAVLNKNEDNLDNSLRLMAPFYRVFANTLGTGPWFDTYIQNIPPVPQVGAGVDGPREALPRPARRPGAASPRPPSCMFRGERHARR